jgi:hypothetical protein
VRLGRPQHHDTKRLRNHQYKGKVNDKAIGVLTRTANDTDGDGLTEECPVYDLLYSSAATKMEPALRNREGTIFFRKVIALAKGRAERERVLGGFCICVGKIKIIYWV